MKNVIPFLTLLLILSCETKVEKERIQEPEKKAISSNELSEEQNQLDTLLNTKDYLILWKEEAKKNGKVKIVKGIDGEDFPNFETLIGYRNDRIIGQNVEYDDVEMYLKYNPTSKFEDYKVEVYDGKLSNPDFSSNPDAKRFITRIKKECQKGINFAGHYTLVYWGCGSPCQSGVVVDRKTGKIFDGYGTALGSEFKKDSEMIIRNVGAIDTTTNLIKLCAYCDVTHEVWTGTTFEEIE